MKKQLAAVFTTLTLAAGNAMAAIPADVQTSMDNTKTDVLALGALGLIIVIGIAGFRYMKRGV